MEQKYHTPPMKKHRRPKRALPVDDTCLQKKIRSEAANRGDYFILTEIKNKVCTCIKTSGGVYAFREEDCYYIPARKRRRRKL